MVSNESHVVRIDIARNDEERERALDFITQVISKWYGCDRPPMPEILFVAKMGTEIVGTSAFNFATDVQPLSLEMIYDFDHEQTPWPFSRKTVAEYIRWTANMRGISDALLYFASCYGLQHNKMYTLCEVKIHAEERLKQLGVDIRRISHARLRLEHIPPNILPYYVNEPLPNLCMGNFMQMKMEFEPKVMKMIEEGKLSLAPF